MWLLPFVIAAGAGIVVYLTGPPAPGMARASITMRPPVTDQTSAAAVNLFLADLEDQVRSDSMILYMLDQVPQLGPDVYPDQLSVDRDGVSSWVTLTFVDAKPNVARVTVETLAARVIDDAARHDFELSSFVLQQAEDRLAQAEADLDSFVSTESVFDPEQEYKVLLDEIAALDSDITRGLADPSGETSVDLLIAERSRLESTREGLGPALLGFQRLTAEVTMAREAVDQALTAQNVAGFQYETINTADNLIGNRDLVEFVDDGPLLQQAALAAATAFALALVTVVPLAWWLEKRRRSGKHIDLTAEGSSSSAETDHSMTSVTSGPSRVS